MEVRRRSSWWFLLPILFSIVGGIIAYFVIKDDDPKRAKSCLWLGIIQTAIGIATLIIPLIIGLSIMQWSHVFNTDYSI